MARCVTSWPPGAASAPPPRRRAARTLSSADREEISRGLAAACLFRHRDRPGAAPTSTVSREVARHGGREGYRAASADTRAWAHARRPKTCRLATRPALRAQVAEKLARDWSPQQIAGWLRDTFPDNSEMQVSHETIYLSLFVQSRGVLKKALVAHLRRARTMRRSSSRRRRGNCAVTSSMPCRSPSDPPVSRIGPSLNIGRATCCRAPPTPTLRPSSNDNRASSCSSASMGKTPPPWSARSRAPSAPCRAA